MRAAIWGNLIRSCRFQDGLSRADVATMWILNGKDVLGLHQHQWLDGRVDCYWEYDLEPSILLNGDSRYISCCSRALSGGCFGGLVTRGLLGSDRLIRSFADSSPGFSLPLSPTFRVGEARSTILRCCRWRWRHRSVFVFSPGHFSSTLLED